MSENRLTRSANDRMLTGVCGGLAAYLGIDSTLVRLAFILLVPASGIGLLIYLLLLILMPDESDPLPYPSGGSGKTVTNRSEDMAPARRPHPQGPTIAGILLVLLGIYLLLDSTWLAWLFWPLLLIGLGSYLVLRRNSQ